MNDLPPKPPRMPPGLIKGALQVGFINLLAIGLNLFSAHNEARDGRDVMLFLSCAFLSLSLWAGVRHVRNIRGLIEDWAEIRRMHEKLVAQHERTRQQRGGQQ